jgi:hypothetical protein
VLLAIDMSRDYDPSSRRFLLTGTRARRTAGGQGARPERTHLRDVDALADLLSPHYFVKDLDLLHGHVAHRHVQRAGGWVLSSPRGSSRINSAQNQQRSAGNGTQGSAVVAMTSHIVVLAAASKCLRQHGYARSD